MNVLVGQLEKDVLELQDKIIHYHAMIKIAEEDDRFQRISHSCGKECFSTPNVNQVVDEIDYVPSYGAHMIFPYVMKDGRKIYSYPVYFDVGCDPEYGYHGIQPCASWESEMRHARISEVVIEQVRGFLAAHPLVNWLNEGDEWDPNWDD